MPVSFIAELVTLVVEENLGITLAVADDEVTVPTYWSVEAIVKLVPEGEREMLLPATIFMSCVPVLAPDLVNLNRTSLEESTQEDVKTFCVFVFVSVEVIVTVPKPSVGDIETLDGSKVYEMRGVSFDKDGKKGSGVIAQEMEKVAPELVNNDNEYKAVAYGNISGYLIEAIKELKQEIEELKLNKCNCNCNK